MAFEAVLAGITSAGRDVVDAGICPVPVMQHFIAKTGAVAGGIAITGSHNSAEWNALKFLREDGTFLNAYQMEELLDIYHRREFEAAPWNRLGRLSTRDDLIASFTADLQACFNRQAIRAASPKVAVDCCNGTGSLITADLLRGLGCEVTVVHGTPDGRFPRAPEPTPANLGDLCRVVRESGAQVGFAQDVDADRLTLVTGEGEALCEDYTLLLAASNVVGKVTGPIVASIDTSKSLDELGSRHGCPVFRSKVGEVNVVEKMRSVGAVIGGEGSGGVIYPPLHEGRDSFAAMGLILELMAGTGKTVSQLVEPFRRQEIVKISIPCPTGGILPVLASTRERYRREELNLTDGIRVDWPDRWFLVRPSDTEPVLRVTAEAPTLAEANALCDEIRALAGKVAGGKGI